MAESVAAYKNKRQKGVWNIKRTILVILMFIFGFHNQAYCQNINVKQSVKNAKIAWESIYSGKKCVLLHKSNERYETIVYEMKAFKLEL